MEIGIRKEETAKWKQDIENRNEELGIKSNSGIEVFRNLGIKSKANLGIEGLRN